MPIRSHKPKNPARCARWMGALVLGLLPFTLPSGANAQLTWDPLVSGTGSDSSGAWNISSANWSNGASDVVWPNTATTVANFGSLSTSGTAGTVTISGAITANALIFNPAFAGNYTIAGSTLTLGGITPTITTNADATITAVMTTGGLALTKSGTGTLNLNDSTFSLPSINVTAGTLSTSNSGGNTFGDSATAIVVSSGAKIQTSGNITVNNAFTFNGGTGDAAVIGGATLGGPISLSSGTTSFNTFSSATISGAITGAGSLSKSGGQKLTLTANNSYTGTTTITNGSIQVGSGGTSGSLGTGAVVNGQVLTFSRSDKFTVPNSISGPGSLVKSGTGTMVLTGSSNYTGTTTISAGTLELDTVVSGSTGSTGSVLIVANAATLSGTGSYAGATAGAFTLMAGGRISPGLSGSIGTLSATSLSWTTDNVTAGMMFDLSNIDGTSDKLALTGAFARTTGTNPFPQTSFLFDFDNSGLLGQTYTLITFASTSSTSLTNLVATDLPTGYSAVFSYNTTTSPTALNVTVVPEPGTTGLLVVSLGVFLLIGMVKRRSVIPMPKLVNAKNVIVGCVMAALAAMSVGSAKADTTFTLETATLSDIQAALDSGNLSSVELVAMYLNRRSVYDQNGLKLNAFVQVSTNVFTDAQAADARRAAGNKIGALDGLPFITKDSYNSLGVAMTGGIGAWKNIFPTADNFLVTQIKAAGAVFMGHGNMDTFANSATSTYSDAYGATMNAYTLGTPAGSSGGPGCGTGADFWSFGFGGETGGSIRNPSDRAGIVGFKVGTGTVSVDGVLPLAPERDVIGPMSRHTADEAAIMEVASTFNPNDEWAAIDVTPGRPKSSGFVAKQATTSLVGKRFGVINTYVGTAYPAPTPAGSTSNTTGNNSISPEILANFNRSVAELRAAGAIVTYVYLPANVDTAVSLGVGQPTRILTTGTTAVNFQAWSYWAFLVSPPLQQNAYVRLSQVPGGRVSAAQLVAVQNQTFVTFSGTEAQMHFQAQTLYMNNFDAFMNDPANQFDALIWPTHTTKTRTTANPPGRDLVNNLGLPLCTVPNGVIPSTGEPTTLAFCGKYRQEAEILAYAHAYEAVTNYRIPTPLAPPLDGETFTYSPAPVGAFKKAAKFKPADIVPPVLSIASVATIKGKGAAAKIVFTGVAVDKDGLGSLKVYVNGRLIPSIAERRWTAAASVSDVSGWIDPGATAVQVLVVAKDSLGNASGSTKTIPLPASF